MAQAVAPLQPLKKIRKDLEESALSQKNVIKAISKSKSRIRRPVFFAFSLDACYTIR